MTWGECWIISVDAHCFFSHMESYAAQRACFPLRDGCRREATIRSAETQAVEVEFIIIGF